MTTLQLPLSHTPPYSLLSLALFKDTAVQWQEANELSEPTYGDVKGVEAVRAELEKGLPGKEVCIVTRGIKGRALIYRSPSLPCLPCLSRTRLSLRFRRYLMPLTTTLPTGESLLLYDTRHAADDDQDILCRLPIRFR